MPDDYTRYRFNPRTIKCIRCGKAYVFEESHDPWLCGTCINQRKPKLTPQKGKPREQ